MKRTASVIFQSLRFKNQRKYVTGKHILVQVRHQPMTLLFECVCSHQSRSPPPPLNFYMTYTTNEERINPTQVGKRLQPKTHHWSLMLLRIAICDSDLAPSLSSPPPPISLFSLSPFFAFHKQKIMVPYNPSPSFSFSASSASLSLNVVGLSEKCKQNLYIF